MTNACPARSCLRISGLGGQLRACVVSGVLLVTLLSTAAACQPSSSLLPVAIVQAPAEAFAGYAAQFDGSASHDRNGGGLTYKWTLLKKPEGSKAALPDAAIDGTSFTPDRLGEYTIRLAVKERGSWSLPADVTLAARPWFADVTDQAGLARPHVTPHGASGNSSKLGRNDTPEGAAWGDYDNDGYDDLYVALGERGSLLYHNSGDGTLTEATGDAGVTRAQSDGAIWGDYDNDGGLDLYTTSLAGQHTLHRNNRDGTFTDVTGTVAPGPLNFTAGAAWGDYDNDGRLDLVVLTDARSVDLGAEATGVYGAISLYRNSGSGGFADATIGAGMRSDPAGAEGRQAYGDWKCGAAWQPLWLDYDGDRYIDLFATCEAGAGANALYHNNRDGTFTDVTREAGFDGSTGTGATVGDYDNDGDPDLYVTAADSSRLWQNNGNGTFSDATTAAGLASAGGPDGSVVFFDFNNDSHLDVLTASGIWMNRGDKTFTDMTVVSGLGAADPIQSLAAGDYDGDGDLDVLVAYSGGRIRLYRNDVANHLGNQWLKVSLQGTNSNRFGIGTRIEVTTPTGVVRTAWPSAGSGLMGQDATALLVGVGRADWVDIRLTWPSGVVQEFWFLRPNHVFRGREDILERTW